MTVDQEIRVKAMEIAIEYYKAMRPSGYTTSKLDIVIQSASKLVPYIKDGVAEPTEGIDQSEQKSKNQKRANTHTPPDLHYPGLDKK